MAVKIIPEKHSAFVTLNGINRVMGIYEQLIMDIPEEEVEILHQQDKDGGHIVYAWSESSLKHLKK